jgi:hypothetical protein
LWGACNKQKRRANEEREKEKKKERQTRSFAETIPGTHFPRQKANTKLLRNWFLSAVIIE